MRVVRIGPNGPWRNAPMPDRLDRRKGDSIMNLKPLGANKTEVKINGSTVVLFSYQTPVAASLVIDGVWHHVRTSKFWSATTSRHINSYMPRAISEERPQEFFDSLIAEVR